MATVEPPVSGVTVYFRVFDVDDPFDQLHGPNAADPADALESRIQAINFDVTPSTWRLKLNGRRCLQREVGPSDAYITIGAPRDTSDPRHTVTIRRMKRAIEYAGLANSLNPHQIVAKVMESLGNFQLTQNPPVNAWLVPDRPSDCQAMVRFAIKVFKMVGAPGMIEHRNIYAVEDNPVTPAFEPSIAIEVPDFHGGLSTDERQHPVEPWVLFLVDGRGGYNGFEAAAVLDACGATRWYPGGTDSSFDNKDDVLTIFDTLSWVAFENGTWTVQQHEFVYPPTAPNAPLPNCP